MRLNFGKYRLRLPASGVMATILICVIVRVMQQVSQDSPIRTVLVHGDMNYLLVQDVLTFLFSIHGIGLSCWFFWTPVTYMFLHGSWMHLILNMIGVAVFGSAIEGQFGQRTYWSVFLSGGVLGGIGWVLANGLASVTPCLGASAGVMSLIGAFSVVSPCSELVVFMPFPVRMRVWIAALGIFFLNAIELVLVSGSNIAYLAHLVGIVSGVLAGFVLRGIHLKSGFRQWRRHSDSRAG